MALTLAGFRLTMSLLGEKNAHRKKTFEIEPDPAALDDDAAFATARAGAVAFVTAWGLITGAVILNFDLSGIYQEDGAVTIPGDADLYTEALLSVGLDSAGFKKGSLAIPAPADGIFVGDDETTQAIDHTDVNLTTMLGHIAAPNWIRISDGEQILSTPKILGSRIRSVSSGKTF